MAPPRSRCSRCDEHASEKSDHKCPHGMLCLPFTQPGHCMECESFKSKQSSLCDKGPAPKPFIKWAGGKRKLVPQLLPFIPRFSGTYFEPFLGGGALFFAMRPRKAVLADSNLRLIRTYRAVQVNVEWVIQGLLGYPVEKGFYLEMRTKPIDDCPSDVEAACWFIYLNKCGYNGMYRVNKKGCFNIPWGKKPSDFNVCDHDTLRACSRQLTNAEILHESFDSTVERCKKGDLVYFDPPYIPVSKTANFTSYTESGFTLADHAKLSEVAAKLKRRGVSVLITNSDTEETRKIFSGKDFTLQSVSARGSLAANPKSRGKRSDLVIF